MLLVLRRWGWRILAVLAAVYVYFAFVHPVRPVAEHVFFRAAGPWAMAHRGGRGLWPENTLYAFQHAAALGVDVVEMDLRVTSDGAIVVMHDARVDRTTDGHGRVSELTLGEVRRLDAGYRFRDAAGGFPFRGHGIGVPTVEEVLDGVERARMNIEMKEFAPEFAERFCGVLREKGATERVLVASMSQGAMTAFRGACPEVATSMTFAEGVEFYVLGKVHLLSLFRCPAVALQTPENLGRLPVVTAGLLARAGELNLRVEVFTEDEEPEMGRLLGMGVQGILTNYPDRLLGVLGR